MGAHKSQIVWLDGSSKAFRSAFAAASVIRSQSSITTTRHFEREAPQAERDTTSLISSILIDMPFTSRISTSGCVPRNAVRQSSHSPQPEFLQIRAAL